MRANAVHLASPDDPADAARLAAAARDDDGPLNDVTRADLVAPGPDSATWLIEDGLAHVQHDARPRSWLLGVDATRAEWPALLERVADHIGTHGGGEVTWWRARADEADIGAATNAGYAVAREQHELRVALPLSSTADTIAPGAKDVQLRTLQPGDVDGVLAVNNAAFAGHAEQGGWTRSMFEARTNQPWFDPTLFVVADAPPRHRPPTAERRILGFNWLKPHAATAADVARGEIYVIAVDPEEHGRGLGRMLAVHGLALLHARGFGWASLFVAADNAAALALYASLGFTIHRTDVAFVTTIAPR